MDRLKEDMRHELDAEARVRIREVVDVVCAELGVRGAEARREAIESNIADSWRSGRRQPLHLVDAGLEAGFSRMG